MSPSHQSSAAAHRALSHANPLSIRHMAELVSALARRRPRTALDIGCGPGSFSVALAEAADVAVYGVDVNPAFLARAEQLLEGRALAGSVKFILGELARVGGIPAVFDAVVCMGSSHALGVPVEALRGCAGLAAPGGTVVFAELVWKAAPATGFLGFLGISEDFYWHRDQGAAVLRRAGLRVMDALHASDSDFDAYEAAILRGRLEHAATLEEAEARAHLNRARQWAVQYEKFGRHCLGFTAYLATPADG